MSFWIDDRSWLKNDPQKGRSAFFIIAGPNGAGKTTFATEYLLGEVDCPRFINADFIAQGLSPLASEDVAFRAGKVMLEFIHESVERGESFAFETTLSGLMYARHIRRWRAAGYFVKLLFLSLPSVDMALSRVKMRVIQGGHDVPEHVVRRRFDAGLKNFQALYRPLVDSWILYDNAGPSLVVVASGDNK